MDIDEVYAQHAEFGLYQQQVFAFLTSFQAFLALHQVHNVFLGATPRFTCDVGERALEDACPDAGQACDRFRFRGDDFTSIVSEFGLACGQAYKANLVQSLYMAGIFLGSFLFGKLADKHGRKPVLCVSAVGMALSSLGGMLARGYGGYVTARFITAVFNGGAGMVSFVLVAELIGSSKRSLAGVVVPTCFGLGIALFALLGHLFRHWRLLTFVTSLPGFIGLYWHWFLPESPRWLYSQKRVSDAESTLDDIIRRNAGPQPATPITLKPATDLSTQGQANGKEGSQGFVSLFTEPLLRSLTLNNAFTWFMNCCTYYGLTMGAGELGSSMYMSLALSGLVEMPAYVATLYLIDSRLGRRLSFAGTMLFGGVVCGFMLMVPAEMENTRTTLALAGKMAVTMSFSVAWLFSAEMYPTSTRNQGISVCTGSARVGGIVSPLLLQAAHAYPNVQYLVFGAGMFLSGIIALRLPETRNKRMPETLQDLYDLAGQGQKSSQSHKAATVREISEDKVKLLQDQMEENDDFEKVSEEELNEEQMENVLFMKT